MSLLATTLGSKQVLVTIPNHGALNGDYVNFTLISSSVGGIPASELNTDHEVSNVTTNTFTINVTTAATSTDTYDGDLKAIFDIHAGNAINYVGYGWGAGAWSRGAWGSGSKTPVVSLARIYTQDRFDDALLFCIRGGDIYYWAYDNTFTTRAVLQSSLAGASAVPQLVSSILFSQNDRHLIAFGGTAYGTGIYDPLLIRWADQNDPKNWTPTTTNSAGFLRVTNGSEIVQAVRTRQEILVLTDSSAYSLQYLGTQDVFGLQQLADNTSIIGPAAAIAVNNVVYWMGKDKFYAYSGRVDTLPCTLRQHVFQDINQDQGTLVISGINEQFNEIIWFYPSANSNEIDRYVIYNYLENLWYYGNLVRTAWLDSPLRPNPQAANNGYLYKQEQGTDDDGSPMTAYISSGDVDIEDGTQFMLMRRLIPDINFTGSTATNPAVTVTIKPRNFPGQAYQTDNAENTGIDKSVTRTATVPVDQYTNQVFIRVRGRQLSFRIGSTDLGVQWQLGMPRIDARPDGRRG